MVIVMAVVEAVVERVATVGAGAKLEAVRAVKVMEMAVWLDEAMAVMKEAEVVVTDTAPAGRRRCLRRRFGWRWANSLALNVPRLHCSTRAVRHYSVTSGSQAV